MAKLTRRRLLCATAPLAAAPLGVKLALGGQAEAAGHDHEAHRATAGHVETTASGHAAMIGEGAPAVGGPNDLDALLYPPEPRPHRPGRLREYTLVAHDAEFVGRRRQRLLQKRPESRTGATPCRAPRHRFRQV